MLQNLEKATKELKSCLVFSVFPGNYIFFILNLYFYIIYFFKKYDLRPYIYKLKFAARLR